MNNNEIEKKLTEVTNALLYEKRFIAPIDVLMKMGFLSTTDYGAWRNGKVLNIESVISVNLSKINFVLRTLNKNCLNGTLKPRQTAYMKWGKRGGQSLQFSKSGERNLEKAYATHYVNMNLKKNLRSSEPK